MHVLHTAAMFTHCVTVGVAHMIPWKLVVAPLALLVGGVFVGRQAAKKRK